MNQPDLFTGRTQPSAPFQTHGDPLSVESSKTGKQHAEATRSANIVMLRQLWREPRTINEIAAITRLPISSVCSLKAALKDELEAVDQEIQVWANGRPTKRTRWQLKRTS